MNSDDWRRVSAARPCHVCGRPDWCMFAGPEDNPTAAICTRIEGSKRCGEAGWLHRLRDEQRPSTWRPHSVTIPTRTKAEQTANRIDFDKQAHEFANALRPEALERFARSLGLSVESLRRLVVGWSARHGAYSFPMKDAAGQVVGIRLRRIDGKKFAVSGGSEGLIVPEGLTPGARLCISEGPTDCAALLDAGLSAIGRPNCSGGLRHIVALVRRLRPSDVAILADADEAGQRGANNLAVVLVAYSPAVRVATPPPGVKDARAWRQAGATLDDITAAIEAAPVRRLAITTSRKQ